MGAVLRVSDWYRHLRYRESAFDDFYPFMLSDIGDVLRVKKSLSLKTKGYVFLLLASNLGYCRQSSSSLTASFEIMSVEVMKSVLPKTAKVYLFGTSARGTGRYSGRIWSKINQLARDLGEAVHAQESDFPAQGSGDNGLDVIGWISCGDGNASRFICLGQCACTPKWIEKQRSSSAEHWRQTITLKADTANVMFIPYCQRTMDGSWHRATDISTILFDRLRYLRSLRDGLPVLKRQPALRVVEQALLQRDDAL